MSGATIGGCPVAMTAFSWKGVRFSPIALGVGSRYVNLVQLKETGGVVSVSAAELARIPAQMERTRGIRHAVRSCLTAGNFKGRRAAICLKGEDIFVQHQRLQLEGKGDVKEKILDEKQLGISSFKLVLNYLKIIPNVDNHLKN